MKIRSLPSPRILALSYVFAAACLALPSTSHAAAGNALVDDFSHPEHTSAGATRIIITDKETGGQSTVTEQFDAGVLKMSGQLVPGRGRPAFVSLVSLLSPQGLPQDVSAYQGVRLRVKVKKGMLAVQVSSTDVDNYDYHTSAPMARNPDAFQDVRIPFNTMKRAWSEQTSLNLKNVTAVNLVAVGMTKEEFAYEVDEIAFY